MPNAQPQSVDGFASAPDGLKVHYVEYGSTLDPGTPVVCLPGLARSAEDFAPLARALAFESATRRRVLALDYRGRGLSEYDRDWNNYNLAVENADILAVLAATEVSRAIVIGTSRGGLHAMTLAAVRPALLHATVLNDIGPIVEPLGLLRIKGYVGKLPAPRNVDEAVDILKSTMSAHFTGLSDEEWRIYARTTFVEKNGKLIARYDLRLTKTLDAITPDMPRIDLWPQFEALAQRPVLVIRGENSDVLSDRTFVEMQQRCATCEGYVAPGQGHAPLLVDAPTIARIAAFVASVG